MATFHISHFIFLTTLFSTLISSLSFPNKPNFSPDLVLLADAKFTNDDVSVQLTNSTKPSSGFLFHRKPIKFLTSKSRKPLSFSTDFTFSISPQSGAGRIAFIIVQKGLLSKISSRGFEGLDGKKFLGVKFDTLGNENRVGINVGSFVSAKTSNLTNLVLNSGVKLRSWVDYDSSSKRIEVRLSESGKIRPYSPLLVYQIDLGEMWRNEEVLVGLSGNSMQTSRVSVYSWQFRTRSVPKGLHSQPLDPQLFSHDQSEKKFELKKRNCALGLVSGLLFLVGWGALLALVAVIVWAVFESRMETVLTIPAKCIVHSEGFRYEKVDVVVGDDSVDLKK